MCSKTFLENSTSDPMNARRKSQSYHNNGQRFPNYKPWPKYEPRARSEVDNQKLSRHPEYYNVEKNATQPLAPLTLPCVEPVRVLSTSHQRSRLIWMCGSILVQFLPLFFLHLSTLVAGAPRNAMRFTGSPRNSPNCLSWSSGPACWRARELLNCGCWDKMIFECWTLFRPLNNSQQQLQEVEISSLKLLVHTYKHTHTHTHSHSHSQADQSHQKLYLLSWIAKM